MQKEVARPAKASSAGCCGLHRLDMNLYCCRLFDLWWFMEWPQWKHERMSACTVPINSNPTCFEILSAKWICERFTGLLLSFFFVFISEIRPANDSWFRNHAQRSEQQSLLVWPPQGFRLRWRHWCRRYPETEFSQVVSVRSRVSHGVLFSNFRPTLEIALRVLGFGTQFNVWS